MADTSTVDGGPERAPVAAPISIKAVRCDKTSPCANCRKHNVKCTTSPRVPRARLHPQINPLFPYPPSPGSTDQVETDSDGKLDSLDQRLERMGRLVENLVAENRPGTRAASSASPLNESDPSPGQTSAQERSFCSGFGTSSPPVAPRVNLEQPKARGTASSTPAQEQQEGDSLPVTEGPSSFSAQSDFAVAFLKKVVGSDRDQGHVFDSLELQDALGHIVDVLHKQQSSLDMAFSATDAPTPVRVRPKMPPIEDSVAVIRSTEGTYPLHPSNANIRYRAKIIIYHLSSVIDVPSISDMCLKFSIASASPLLEMESSPIHSNELLLFGQHDDQEENKAICAENLTNALARLSLYIKPSFDMTFALILGAVFAMESFKPLLSCTLITAAYQAAYSLGYHTRQKGADKGSDSPNKAGLLFWAIYFLERSFTLGLGRSSTIPNSDITVPLPGGPKFPLNSGMNAYRNMVRTARLSGRVYEDLYSAEALHLPANVRQQTVAELTRELQDIRETHRQVRDAIPTNQSDPAQALKMKQLVEFIYHSDEIHCLSILTLIQRAAPPPTTGPSKTFTEECIASARSVIEIHHKFVPLLKERGTPFVSAQVNWVLNFMPFISFVVLFCHVIETGNDEDLNRMGNFVQSMEVASTFSNFKDNHHRLFQVLHTVASRYSELKASLTPSQVNSAELRTEMDAYLSSLGYQPTHQDMAQDFTALPTMSYLDMPMDTSVPHPEVEPNPQLANWFSWSQQMIGLLDSNQPDI
ncbi:unnamed protein product [Clonostachys solani]|uniref:Xylanolytic transcriptional activator regulatory domain-containing protein n=1 Tax=Clonostachys solani TaxID=160281 RepID=A0A9N9ZA82_9HYPO|nr:unnamed protein product [Clonostachys solani]